MSSDDMDVGLAKTLLHALGLDTHGRRCLIANYHQEAKDLCLDVLEMEISARDAIRSVTGLAALLGIDELDASSRCATVRPSLTEEFDKKQ